MRALPACLLALAALLSPFAAAAQSPERPNTILVLDASGSMWGQIDGVNKIVIAREVIGGLLSGLPQDTSLGLTVYGHRERGSCADIETLVNPAPGTIGQILEAVNSINPRGRTPMTDAVVAAAGALRHTENAATVILVSDGIENCNPDPCAIARALEETGVDFTAHVIGFDVAGEPEALAQMQCIAENTGGMFLTADNAAELSAALEQVVQAPPALLPVPVTFRAVVEPDMTPPASPLRWTLSNAAGAVLLGPVEAPGGNVALLPGDYRLMVERVTQGTLHEARFAVMADTPQEVVIPLPALMVEITLSARIGAEDGALVTDPVEWEVTPLDEGITITADNPASLMLLRGAYRVTGYWTAIETERSADFVVVDTPREIVLVFDAPLPRASVTAPPSAVAGSTIEVGWTGPDEESDYIGIGRVDATGGQRWQNFTYTRDGSPLELEMPPEPGEYLIRYFMNQDNTVLAEVPITLTPATAGITAPPSAVAGSTIEVGWTGPDYHNDYIGVGRRDATGGQRWQNFTYTRDGSPLRLEMPPEPGEYLIRYFMNQDNTILAEVPITLTPATAGITAPATAVAGSTIEVGWTGPDEESDYIGVGRVDATGGQRWQNFTYTRDGSPLELEMPPEPGEYLIRYFLNQDNTVLAEVPITLTPATAGITAPPSAVAGATIEVGWTGPDYHNDYIGVGRREATGGQRWQNFTYTRDGSPLRLEMPPEPGEYLIRYFMNQDNTILAEVPITLTPATAAITAPPKAAAGSTIEIGWTGPDYDSDYIGIGLADATGGRRWESFTYTREGSPLRLDIPEEPGDYLIRYFMNQDNTILAEVPITVE
jgi:Ca-activated chloride channel homolog